MLANVGIVRSSVNRYAAAMRASERRQRVIDVSADRAWAVVGRPELLHLWFPGIVACRGRGHHPHDHHRHRPRAGRGDPHQRPAPAPLPVPDHRRLLRGAPRPRSTSSTSATTAASSSTPATPTRPPWPSCSAVPPRARSASWPASSRRAPARPRRDRERGRQPDGPQDPVRHHRPAALRHARLQRRRAQPHAGGRPPRRRRASATSGPCPSRWCACRRAPRCSPASTRAPTACG